MFEVHVHGEPVAGVVGERDRLLFVVEGHHAEHGPEDLGLGDRRRVVDVDEDGRLDEEALGEIAAHPPTAAQDLRGTGGLGLGEQADDASTDASLMTGPMVTPSSKGRPTTTCLVTSCTPSMTRW